MIDDSRPAIDALTGLRFFAALAVIIKHASVNIFRFQPLPFIESFNASALFGMSLFFVLSGFIIHYNYGAKIEKGGVKAAGVFLFARFSRLYPLYLALVLFDLFAGNVFLTADREHQAAILSLMPTFLTMTQTWWLFGADGIPAAFPMQYSVVAWSISTEAAFYIAYLFGLFLLIRVQRPLPLLVSAAIVLVVYSVGIYVMRVHSPEINTWALSLGIGTSTTMPFVEWFWYLSPIGRLPEFVAGCLAAQLFLALRDRPVSRGELIAASVAGILAAALLIAKLFPTLFYGVPELSVLVQYLPHTAGMAALIFIVARYRGALRATLEWRPIVALGDASYSTYMLHLIIITGLIVPGFWPPLPEQWLFFLCRFLLMCGLIWLLSLGSYRYFEMPVQSWLRRRLAAAMGTSTAPRVATDTPVRRRT